MEIKKKSINDIELAYYVRGKGDPLIMIMGYRGTMAMWDPALLEALEKNYTLILFDNRGIGLSTDTQEDFTTVPQMAEDTYELIKALGYAKAHVLGWSLGSRIAQVLASSHPEIVDSLILCAPNPGGSHSAARETSAYDDFINASDLTDEQIVSYLYPNNTNGRAAASAYIERFKEALKNGTIPRDINLNKKAIIRQKHALDLWSESGLYYDALTNILAPTLIADGLDDDLDPPENVLIIAKQIPFAWTAYFSGSGHAFLSQEYKHFAELVHLFIESDKSK